MLILYKNVRNIRFVLFTKTSNEADFLIAKMGCLIKSDKVPNICDCCHSFCISAMHAFICSLVIVALVMKTENWTSMSQLKIFIPGRRPWFKFRLGLYFDNNHILSTRTQSSVYITPICLRTNSLK